MVLDLDSFMRVSSLGAGQPQPGYKEAPPATPLLNEIHKEAQQALASVVVKKEPLDNPSGDASGPTDSEQDRTQKHIEAETVPSTLETASPTLKDDLLSQPMFGAAQASPAITVASTQQWPDRQPESPCPLQRKLSFEETDPEKQVEGSWAWWGDDNVWGSDWNWQQNNAWYRSSWRSGSWSQNSWAREWWKPEHNQPTSDPLAVAVAAALRRANTVDQVLTPQGLQDLADKIATQQDQTEAKQPPQSSESSKEPAGTEPTEKAATDEGEDKEMRRKRLHARYMRFSRSLQSMLG